MQLTFQEVLDLTQAIIDAQRMLALRPSSPVADAYYDRLQALSHKLREYIYNKEG